MFGPTLPGACLATPKWRASPPLAPSLERLNLPSNAAEDRAALCCDAPSCPSLAPLMQPAGARGGVQTAHEEAELPEHDRTGPR